MKACSTYISIIILIILSPLTHAEDSTVINTDLIHRPHLLGDFGGYRTQLEDQGITVNLSYTGEFAHNLKGGAEQTSAYTDQFSLGTTFDLNKLLQWRGATFQVTLNDRNGGNLNLDAGLNVIQKPQEVYGTGQTLRLAQFWLGQNFFDDKVNLKLGRMAPGDDFSGSDCDFENNLFCGGFPGRNNGDYWYNGPISAWAARLKAQTSSSSYIQFGAYQVNPTYADARYAKHNGWKITNPGGTIGTLVPLEFGWMPEVHKREGLYRLGFWYSNADGKDLLLNQAGEPLSQYGGSALQVNSRYGTYLSLEQQVTGQTKKQGFLVFLNTSLSDETSKYDRTTKLGLKYYAPFDRENDMIVFALGTTHINHRYTQYQNELNQINPGHQIVVNHDAEYLAELNYQFSPIRSVTLMPNLQYYVHPSGSGIYKNIFIAGLKTNISF